MGWVDRPLAIRLAGKTSGSTEHSITEIWSNQYGKWVMFDPTYALYVTRDGLPLSAWEIRQEWFYHGGKRLTFVIGTGRKKHSLGDLPVKLATHPGYGDLRLTTKTLDKYAFLAYVPNTNLMDAPLDYGRMFISKDKRCDGTKWHRRDNPTDPAREPYFPINQAAMTLRPATGAELSVKLDTFTPNFSRYEHRIDAGAWTRGKPPAWRLHAGANTLEVVAVNKFGVRGTTSEVTLNVAK